MIHFYVHLCILVVASILLRLYPIHLVPIGPQLHHDCLNHLLYSQEPHQGRENH
jgi:hypothetical protein